MKKGTTASWHSDGYLEIRKSRGKFSLDEIEDVLRYGRDVDGQTLCGNYAMIFRCNEETCGGNGLYDLGVQEPAGDIVRLYELNEGGECPICQNYLPPLELCPHCGEKWKTEET